MKRGRVTCWNLSWMKSRMESARARPDGPVVSAAQSMSMDIYIVFGILGEVSRSGFGGSAEGCGLISDGVFPAMGLLGFVDDSFCVLGYCSSEYFLPTTVVFLGEPGEAVGSCSALPLVPQLWDSKYLLSQERDNLTPSLWIYCK